MLTVIKQIKIKSQLKMIQEKNKIYLHPLKFKTILCIDLDETLIYADFKKKFNKCQFVNEGNI